MSGTTDRSRATAVAGAALLVALSGCSTSDPGEPPGGPSPARLSGTVTVFAAASLKEVFTDLGERFEKARPGTTVTFSFGGSDSLAAGIASGAPADVFAAASEATMQLVTRKGAVAGTPRMFARNRLQIATPPGNPDKVASLKDLTKGGLKVALCDTGVPCGAAARKALDTAGLTLTPVSYEQDVKSALTKVALKEVDAAVVYKTDVKAAGGKVGGVAFPESDAAVNTYPVARLKDAPNAAAAEAFIDLVMSAEGRTVLRRAGFLAP